MTGFKTSFKIQIYESLFQKFFMIFITISEELNYYNLSSPLLIFQSYICTIPIYTRPIILT